MKKQLVVDTYGANRTRRVSSLAEPFQVLAAGPAFDGEDLHCQSLKRPLGGQNRCKSVSFRQLFPAQNSTSTSMLVAPVLRVEADFLQMIATRMARRVIQRTEPMTSRWV